LYNHGGLYSDLDIFALKEFPNPEWLTTVGANRGSISLGLLKAPPGEEVFRECMIKVRKKWGNVQLFNKEYKKFYGNNNPTHKDGLFFPYKWTNCYNLFRKMEIPKNSLSISFYIFGINAYLKSFRIKISYKVFHHNINLPQNLNELNEQWCEKNKETLLGKLWQWLQN